MKYKNATNQMRLMSEHLKRVASASLFSFTFPFFQGEMKAVLKAKNSMG